MGTRISSCVDFPLKRWTPLRQLWKARVKTHKNLKSSKEFRPEAEEYIFSIQPSKARSVSKFGKKNQFGETKNAFRNFMKSSVRRITHCL